MSDLSPHVLLIEDNPGDADLVRLRLVEANSDMKVRSANRLSTGLESMEQSAPAVVLLDLNLPDSRGAETFRRVLKQAPGVAVVVLSGHDDEELAAKAVHQGVQDYLIKGSFNSKQLARAMRYAIERQSLITSLDMSRKQQLQFKDEFLSHVSHELRTPLTSIHQFVTILLDGLAGEMLPEQREHLDTILKSANQLRAMIGDLLEATRAESGKLRIETRCISIADVIQQAVSMLGATASEKEIVLEMYVESGIPFLTADPERALQILINLLDNALKFTPARGSVVVKACLIGSDPDFAYISVADTGRGISAEARPLVFERLYQDPNAVHESRRGLGLGLCIVQELVRLHGGRIWLESQVGHGSIFTFTLPVFSLPKLLLPIISDGDKLRGPLSLVAVTLTPRGIADLRETRDICKNILESCICQDKDILLPPLTNAGGEESFFVVASTDAGGAEILQKRISGKLDRSVELHAKCTSQIGATGIPLSDYPPLKPISEIVEDIARTVTSFVMAALKLETPLPADNPPPLYNQLHTIEKRGSNGKT